MPTNLSIGKTCVLHEVDNALTPMQSHELVLTNNGIAV
jgi:hypothetical protein